MKIATWNVNSVKARLTHLLGWLKESAPDIALLQELKTVEEAFPAMEMGDLGYNIAVCGQKTYNGVAILSKYPLEDISKTLPGDEADGQARYIEAVVDAPTPLRVASVYVPNGQEEGSDKFSYKLRFLERLHAHAKHLLGYEEVLAIGGDYNVAPFPEDVYNPQALEGSVCYHPEERSRFRKLLHAGFYDAWRALHPQAHAYSWWDYRGGGWDHNKGLRIDHLLLSPQATDRLESAGIDEAMRAAEKASDHAPVWCVLRG